MPNSYIEQYEGQRSLPVAFESLDSSAVAEVVAALARTDRQPWRADFRTGTLDSSLWTLVQTGAGMTVDASTGNLLITTGTTTNSETIIRSVVPFRIPVRTQAAVTLSQRIANQEFYVELTNLTGDVFARWKFDGTVNTTGKVETASGSLAANQSLNLAATTGATSAAQLVEIDLALDEANFRTRALTGGAATERGTRSDNLPHMDDDLYLQIRAKNLGTAPASTTTFTINHAIVQDVNELAVEVVGGRGTGGSNSAIVVNPLGLATSSAKIGATGAAAVWLDTNRTAQAAGATVTGTGRDLYVAATGVAVNGSTAYPKEYRALAVSDQAGTLHLEVSVDNTTWRRIASYATSTQGGNQVAQFTYAPVARYARVVYVNGGTLQGFFQLSEAWLAA